MRRTSPTQPSSRPKTGSRRRDLVGEPGPGRDLEAVVAQHPDRRRVGAQRPLRLVDDHPEQLLPVVRGGQAPGDAEDGVEALGELGLDADRPSRSRVAGRLDAVRAAGRHRRRSGGGSRPRRRDRLAAPVVGTAVDDPATTGFALGVVWARAHVPMVAPRGRPAGPPSVPVPARTFVPGTGRPVAR